MLPTGQLTWEKPVSLQGSPKLTRLLHPCCSLLLHDNPFKTPLREHSHPHCCAWRRGCGGISGQVQPDPPRPPLEVTGRGEKLGDES